MSRTSRSRALELAFPGLADEVVAEAVMRLGADEMKPGALVEAPRADEHVVGPQRDAAIAGEPGEAQAFRDKALADAEPARLLLDEQKAQLRHLVARLHEEHRADDLALLLGDPAALALRIEALEELGRD